MTGQPIWYDLMTPDPDAVRDFYRAVVGWEIATTGMTAGSDDDAYRTIQRSDGGMAGGVLKLSQAMLSHGAKAGWLPYFHVEDVAASADKARTLGGHVWMEPQTIEVGTIAMLGDPQAGAFYIMNPVPPSDRPDAQSDVFQPAAPGHCWWNELETSDEPDATRFYTQLLDWTAENAMPMGDKGEYRFIEANGQPLGAINPWMADYMTVGWVPYFGVTDIHAAKTAAEAKGGTINQDVHEVPGGDLIFTAADPTGAPVGFVGKQGVSP